LSKWQQLLEELTYHEIAVLQAYAKIEPWGEKRSDMREAWLAAAIMGSLGGEAPDPNKLMQYMAKDDEPADEGFVSPNSAAASMAQMFPGLIK
jgi:hypothetical protein